MPLHNLYGIDKYCQTDLQLIVFYNQEWRQHKLALFNKRVINRPGLDNYPQASTYRSGKTVQTTGASSK